MRSQGLRFRCGWTALAGQGSREDNCCELPACFHCQSINILPALAKSAPAPILAIAMAHAAACIMGSAEPLVMAELAGRGRVGAWLLSRIAEQPAIDYGIRVVF